MKYTEFIQLKELLENNNISIKEFIDNPDIVNSNMLIKEEYDSKNADSILITEGLIGSIFKNLGKNIFGAIKSGIKNLISLGVKEEYIRKLDQDANTIIDEIIETLEKVNKKSSSKKEPEEVSQEETKESVFLPFNSYCALFEEDDEEEDDNEEIDVVKGSIIDLINKNSEIRKNNLKEKVTKELNDAEDKEEIIEIKEKYKEALKQIDNYRIREIAKYIRELCDTKFKQVEESIHNKKGLSDEHRKALLNYWEQLKKKVNLGISAILVKHGIIEEDDAYNLSKYIFKGITPLSKKIKSSEAHKEDVEKTPSAESKELKQSVIPLSKNIKSGEAHKEDVKKASSAKSKKSK